jgi:diketogulonate reductase-like aldo/keto reductase
VIATRSTRLWDWATSACAAVHHAKATALRLQVDAIDLYQSHWDDEARRRNAGPTRACCNKALKAIGASNLT